MNGEEGMGGEGTEKRVNVGDGVEEGGGEGMEEREREGVEEGDGSERVEERRWRFLMEKVEDDSGETSDQSEKLYQTFQQ